MKDTTKLTQTKIIPVLNDMGEDTRDLTVDMLTYSIYPIEEHPQVALMLRTLIECATLPESDNPIIVAARVVRSIYDRVHGQQEALEDIVQLLMMEYLDFANVA